MPISGSAFRRFPTTSAGSGSGPDKLSRWFGQVSHVGSTLSGLERFVTEPFIEPGRIGRVRAQPNHGVCLPSSQLEGVNQRSTDTVLAPRTANIEVAQPSNFRRCGVRVGSETAERDQLFIVPYRQPRLVRSFCRAASMLIREAAQEPEAFGVALDAQPVKGRRGRLGASPLSRRPRTA